eukprot:755221-Hanusia_phi.AAC.1
MPSTSKFPRAALGSKSGTDQPGGAAPLSGAGPIPESGDRTRSGGATRPLSAAKLNAAQQCACFPESHMRD